MMDVSARSLKIKRDTITKYLEEGLYPYTKRYLGTFNNHFSTIGLVGMNEACLNACWIKKDLTTKEAQDFTKDVLNHMRNRLSDYQEKYGDLFNLEATPAESTSYRLAKKDKELYPDIITASNDETPYYTNSSHLPVGYTDDIFSALDIQDNLQTLYTSGTVFHAFLGERIPDWKACANLVRKIAENYKLPYYTMSPTYSICQAHGYINGEVCKCPTCGKETEIYSRITGYYRPIKNWNNGKTKEFQMRKEYEVDFSALAKGSNAGIPENAPVIDSSDYINDDPVDVTGNVVEFPKQETAQAANFDTAMKFEMPKESLGENGLYLFGMKTCTNCKTAKEFFAENKVNYNYIDAEDNMDKSVEFGIVHTPTLVAVNGGTIQKFDTLSSIEEYITKHQF
jgi:ribonucleoside-triphosphate reductase